MDGDGDARATQTPPDMSRYPSTYDVAGSAAVESPACPRACDELVRAEAWASEFVSLALCAIALVRGAIFAFLEGDDPPSFMFIQP